jgi:hypothetical protein
MDDESSGEAMKKRRWMAPAVTFAVILAAAVYGYQHWGGRTGNPRNELLSALPPDADAVVYIDVAALRDSTFLKELFAWAPKPNEDPAYAQFVRETGFDYERDLDQVAIAIEKTKDTPQFFAFANGRFDQKKIAAFAERTGTREIHGGHEIFRATLSGSKESISFAFAGRHRIALTNRVNLAEFLDRPHNAADLEAWRVRFERLAGSPVFAVIRQDALAGDALAEKAPGGLSSPQLASLLGQLEWITIAGKPDGPQMQIIAEGETPDSSLALQLSDFLKGILVLAEAGLSDPKVQGHLDAESREAYEQLLRSADISRIDRGETKSVRAVIEITPKIFEVARTVQPETAPEAPQQDQRKTEEGKRGAARKPVHAH